MQKATFTVTGMSCVNCAARIEKGLAETAGISRASVNFAMEELLGAGVYMTPTYGNTLMGLACGKPIRGKVAFLGGPLHFLPETRKLFISTLGLSPQETALIELKLHLAQRVRERRKSLNLTQSAPARRLKSSQSRAAKIETGDPSVSIDLLVRSLLALGTSVRFLRRTLCF